MAAPVTAAARNTARRQYREPRSIHCRRVLPAREDQPASGAEAPARYIAAECPRQPAGARPWPLMAVVRALPGRFAGHVVRDAALRRCAIRGGGCYDRRRTGEPGHQGTLHDPPGRARGAAARDPRPPRHDPARLPADRHSPSRTSRPCVPTQIARFKCYSNYGPAHLTAARNGGSCSWCRSRSPVSRRVALRARVSLRAGAAGARSRLVRAAHRPARPPAP